MARRGAPRTRWFGATALSLSAVWLLPQAAQAQEQLLNPPPANYSLDPRGVDLIKGTYNFDTTDVVIGQPGAGGLDYSRAYVGPGWRDNTTGTIQLGFSGEYFVSVGGFTERFTLTGGVYVPTENVGATLVSNGAGGHIYTSPDGTAFEFGAATGWYASPTTADQGRLNSVTYPSGERVTYYYRTVLVQTGNPNDPVVPAGRLESITNNYGYQIKFRYVANTPSNISALPSFYRMNGATGFNMAIDYCDPGAVFSACVFTETWPSATYTTSGTTQTVTDQSGRATVYTFNANRVASLQSPASASPDVVIGYGASGVSSVTVGSGTWNYAYVDSGSNRTTTVTAPDTGQTVATGNLLSERIFSIRDPLGHTTSFQYDGQLRVNRVTRPEGDYIQYLYDGRGNLTQVTAVGKSGSLLPNLVATATYPTTCANPVTCNLPTSATDPLGAVTDYTYDPGHGGVLTVTPPAPTPGATRPQVRIAYAAQHAWYKDSSGAIVQDPTTITMPSAVSSCITGAACAGTANEQKTEITYGASGVANNLLPTVIGTGAGNGSLTATTTYAYTSDGDVASVNGPLTGTSDTTRFRYDDARQQVGVVGPDPDGSGPLKPRALRTTYNNAGQVTLTEQGTVTGFTDPDWAAFLSIQQLETTYDADLRPSLSRTTAGGVTYALNQVSYDTSNRVSCSTVRMNPATFASPPASACTAATAGTFGPDRIDQMTYNLDSQVSAVTSGLGTAAALTESTTYTANGKVQTLVDGDGNRSTLEYDGFDRFSKLRYPEAANGSVSSTTDFMQYGYDENGNVVSTRTRNAQNFIVAYDALNRPIGADNPPNVGDTSYAYDLLGRMTLVTHENGKTVAMTWDALNRQLTETDSVLGTTSMRYDLVGRRTRLTWPDAFYVTYDYDLTNAMTSILGNGTAAYTAYAYDDLGRRIQVTRGNGITTTYGYDPASRLTSLAHNLPGSPFDQTWTLAYNPAGQIVTRAGSNAAYDNPAPATGSDSYPINGLNQSGAGGLMLPYDLKGNLLGDATQSYTYDQANRLTSHTSGGVTATLTYDPLGRLSEMVGTQGARYLYDGQQIAGIATNASPTLINRIVQGPWPDEVAVVYPTSSTPLWNLQDNLGSTVAITTNAGTPTNILAYDEYGVPKSTNTGRFQYTGQLWLPDFGIYHYKARAYNPTLGRFLQTDPMGYAAGMNLYGYVNADPINFTDPSGLQDYSVVSEVGVTGHRPRYIRPAWANAGSVPFLNERTGVFAGQSAAESIATRVDDIAVVATRAGPSLFRRGLLALARLGNLPLAVIQTWGDGSGLARDDTCTAHPEVCSAVASPAWPAVAGAEEWGRRNGVGAAEGRRKFHRIKNKVNGGAREDFRVDPKTGAVYDPEGNEVGNLNESP